MSPSFMRACARASTRLLSLSTADIMMSQTRRTRSSSSSLPIFHTTLSPDFIILASSSFCCCSSRATVPGLASMVCAMLAVRSASITTDAPVDTTCAFSCIWAKKPSRPMNRPAYCLPSCSYTYPTVPSSSTPPGASHSSMASFRHCSANARGPSAASRSSRAMSFTASCLQYTSSSLRSCSCAARAAARSSSGAPPRSMVAVICLSIGSSHTSPKNSSKAPPPNMSRNTVPMSTCPAAWACWTPSLPRSL
mmetsp:Transcript_17893/g.37761  ORF Transcript_17893/g.37761 Transcript_17893/m.37761 type:complete len:251 (+) Transcript_17893:176-928(+)